MSDRREMSANFDGAVTAPEIAKPKVDSIKINDPTQTQAEAKPTTEGMVLQYPYENQDYYMASIKFSLYSIDPYKIDAEAAKSIVDTQDDSDWEEIENK